MPPSEGTVYQTHCYFRVTYMALPSCYFETESAEIMGGGTPSQNGAFNKLPIELNKEIASHLDDHKDIANFNAICKSTSNAIIGDNNSFWRAKFCKDFALPPNMTNAMLRAIYIERCRWLRRFVNMKTMRYFQFVRGHTYKEKIIIRILTDLINQSFTGVQTGVGPNCPNMLRLKEFVRDSRLLLGGRRPPPPELYENYAVNESLTAIRIMATHFLLGDTIQPGAWFAMDDAQRAVYSPAIDEPLYVGHQNNTVKLDWFLQCLNFFRYYMTMSEASDFHDALHELDISEQPSAWDGALKPGSHALGNNFLGTYAYLRDFDFTHFRRMIRQDRFSGQMLNDLHIDEGNIQSLYLDFSANLSKLHWPQIFENHLHSLRPALPSQARAQHSQESAPVSYDSFRFEGDGDDFEEHYNVSGWLNPLPPQAGIPGWQRFTMMKHFEDDLKHVRDGNLCAYEGLVLPGGKIIVGRWWYASEHERTEYGNEFGGPFIFWAVEPEEKTKGRVDEDG
ncbi:hypothetical protein PMIN03_012185 [Paraphaeosphaeria minitans]